MCYIFQKLLIFKWTSELIIICHLLEKVTSDPERLSDFLKFTQEDGSKIRCRNQFSNSIFHWNIWFPILKRLTFLTGNEWNKDKIEYVYKSALCICHVSNYFICGALSVNWSSGYHLKPDRALAEMCMR